MADMMGALKRRLEERVKQISEDLGRGGAESFTEYREAVGKVHALNEVLSEIRDLREKYGLD
jgi:hypothetical protein